MKVGQEGQNKELWSIVAQFEFEFEFLFPASPQYTINAIVF